MIMQYQRAWRALGMCLFVCVVTFFLAGCGPTPNHATYTDNPVNALMAFGASAADPNQWNCGYHLNVANNGFDYSFNGNFEVCVNRNDTSKFMLSGYTNTTSLCAYPMKSNSNVSSVSMVEAPKCFSITSGSSVVLDFVASNINYMIVVPMNYTTQMNQCLGSSAACPAYSKGFVQ